MRQKTSGRSLGTSAEKYFHPYRLPLGDIGDTAPLPAFNDGEQPAGEGDQEHPVEQSVAGLPAHEDGEKQAGGDPADAEGGEIAFDLEPLRVLLPIAVQLFPDLALPFFSSLAQIKPA